MFLHQQSSLSNLSESPWSVNPGAAVCVSKAPDNDSSVPHDLQYALLPSNRPSFYRSWSENDMVEAVKSVLSGKLKISEAARAFKVPKSSVQNRVAKARLTEKKRSRL